MGRVLFLPPSPLVLSFILDSEKWGRGAGALLLRRPKKQSLDAGRPRSGVNASSPYSISNEARRGGDTVEGGRGESRPRLVLVARFQQSPPLPASFLSRRPKIDPGRSASRPKVGVRTWLPDRGAQIRFVSACRGGGRTHPY